MLNTAGETVKYLDKTGYWHTVQLGGCVDSTQFCYSWFISIMVRVEIFFSGSLTVITFNKKISKCVCNKYLCYEDVHEKMVYGLKQSWGI